MPRRRRGRFEAEQANLFHPRRVRPEWEALPVEAREEVTKLLARVLKAHRARHAAPAGGAEPEVQDDRASDGVQPRAQYQRPTGHRPGARDSGGQP